MSFLRVDKEEPYAKMVREMGLMYKKKTPRIS